MSNFKSPHFAGLSECYDHEPLKYMISQRKPNTIFLRQIKTEDGRKLYAVDGDAGFTESSNEVLLKMGKYMEKMFTTDSDYFNYHYLLDPATNQPKPGAKVDTECDYYRYMRIGNMLLRSQIDTQGEDENGNPIVFELKTRATAPIRYDIEKYVDYLDYSIVKLRGNYGSFEREFYDLIRGGFLKFIMQLKIGQMQGAMIAYHNTQKVFGFEYVKLEEMERRIFGSEEFSNIIFSSCLSLLEDIFDHILEDRISKDEDNDVPKRYRIGFYATNTCGLKVMFEMFENDDIYLDRFRNYYNPDDLKDIIDTYLQH